MEFKKIKLQDYVLFGNYFEKDIDRIFDFTRIGSFMWGEYFNQEYALENDILFFKYQIYNGEVAFNIPCCDADKREEAYCLLGKYCKEHSIPLVFKEVTHRSLSQLSKVYKVYEAISDNDWAEYIYDVNDLATLVGKKFNKKRNHLNKFFSLYGEKYKVAEIDDSNVKGVIEFQNKFLDNKGDVSEIEKYENEHAVTVLENIQLFKLNSLVLYVDDKIVAYTIGEVIGDMLFVHIEKADISIQGSYNMINKEFVMKMKEKYPNIELVNRSDDAGDLGLRKAKKSYNPIDLYEKYIVRIDLTHGCEKFKNSI